MFVVDSLRLDLHSLWDGLLIAKAIRSVPYKYNRPLPNKKIEFALRASRKAYLRKYGVPLYALLCASEDALQKVMVGGSACSVAGVGLRRVRIRFVVRALCSSISCRGRNGD